MKIATLLVIVLSNHGYWFGGDPATVALYPVINGSPSADLLWELRYDGVRLAHGTAQIAGEDKGVFINVNPPKVRVRVTMHWVYRVVERQTAKELETGDLPVYVFPDDLMQELAGRMGRRRLMVCDAPNGLSKVLESTGVSLTRVSEPGQLAFARPEDIVLVGKDVLSDSPFAQSTLVHLAEAGASVMVFRQSETSRLLAYPVVRRAEPSHFTWQSDHPLLYGFEPQDLQSWTATGSALRVVELPADEPVLAIASYPRETASGETGPVDALLASKSVGRGRIVFCQLPLGDWKTDPRSQLFLRNALDYLVTRAQPTPARPRPPAGRATEVVPRRAVLIPPGGQQ